MINRGFTGQEHMDPVCAINFNARLYDPTIARFLSADSMVPDQMNSQSFMRRELQAASAKGFADSVEKNLHSTIGRSGRKLRPSKNCRISEILETPLFCVHPSVPSCLDPCHAMWKMMRRIIVTLEKCERARCIIGAVPEVA